MLDTKVHLCSSCSNSFPTCDANKIVFGDGIGNDNIIQCDNYKVKTFTDSDIAVLIQSTTPTMNMHTAQICADLILEKFENKLLIKDTIVEIFEQAIKEIRSIE